MEHGNYDIILFGHNIKAAVFSRAATLMLFKFHFRPLIFACLYESVRILRSVNFPMRL